jgi:hypothetical protein
VTKLECATAYSDASVSIFKASWDLREPGRQKAWALAEALDEAATLVGEEYPTVAPDLCTPAQIASVHAASERYSVLALAASQNGSQQKAAKIKGAMDAALDPDRPTRTGERN